MARPHKILVPVCLAVLLGLISVGLAWAFPPLPSSFYGRVKVNDTNAPEGVLVRALIDGQPYAEGRIQMYEGESVYSLDVRGDDAGSPERDGGLEGEVIHFEVGGVLAAQTGAWHSGTNVELNLTVNTTGLLNTPPPSVAPPPTQTPIAIVGGLPTPLTEDNPATQTAVRREWIWGVSLLAVAGLIIVGAAWARLRRRR